MADQRLSGVRILIVEDEPLVAMLVADLLRDDGADVLGPAEAIDDALALLADGAVEGAPHVVVLDMNLGGDPCDPIAEALVARGIPFVLATGYGPDAVPARFAAAPVVSKPFETEELVRVVAVLVGRG
jgi:CheY-like chemotaxis protein